MYMYIYVSVDLYTYATKQKGSQVNYLKLISVTTHWNVPLVVVWKLYNCMCKIPWRQDYSCTTLKVWLNYLTRINGMIVLL